MYGRKPHVSNNICCMLEASGGYCWEFVVVEKDSKFGLEFGKGCGDWNLHSAFARRFVVGLCPGLDPFLGIFRVPHTDHLGRDRVLRCILAGLAVPFASAG